MLKVEVVGKIYYTCTFTDEEEKKIVEYIKDNPEDFKFMSNKQKILNAIEALWGKDELDLYKNTVESDYQTAEINWSEFEQKTPAQILTEG